MPTDPDQPTPKPTPEQEAAFEEWLSDPENKRRWDEAIAQARARMEADRA
jgi:hypothetical protein